MTKSWYCFRAVRGVYRRAAKWCLSAQTRPIQPNYSASSVIPDLGDTALRLGGLRALGYTDADIAKDLGLTLRDLRQAQQELSRHPA